MVLASSCADKVYYSVCSEELVGLEKINKECPQVFTQNVSSYLFHLRNQRLVGPKAACLHYIGPSFRSWCVTCLSILYY